MSKVSTSKPEIRTAYLFDKPVTIRNMDLIKVASKHRIGPFETDKWDTIAIMDVINLANPEITVKMMEEECNKSLGFIEVLVQVFLEGVNIKN